VSKATGIGFVVDMALMKKTNQYEILVNYPGKIKKKIAFGALDDESDRCVSMLMIWMMTWSSGNGEMQIDLDRKCLFWSGIYCGQTSCRFG
jgi:hypothetical protein